MHYQGHRDQQYGHVTYAQHGDDIMLLNLTTLLGISKPTWLDLGAHHPVNISNTKLLYDRGCSGYNVEANPDLIVEFRKSRPRDVNINMGVGLKNEMKKFYMYGATSGRNTFSESEVETMCGKLHVSKILTLPVITINQLIKDFCNGVWPNLLLCDIEGLDFDVLKSAVFTEMNRPKIIVVETRRHDTQRMIEMLDYQGYAFICRMGENLFFIHAPLWKEVI